MFNINLSYKCERKSSTFELKGLFEIAFEGPKNTFNI